VLNSRAIVQHTLCTPVRLRALPPWRHRRIRSVRSSSEPRCRPTVPLHDVPAPP
jgi:hypothetical protein